MCGDSFFFCCVGRDFLLTLIVLHDNKAGFYMPLKNTGVLLGLLFCFISAAFDVYVAFVMQVLNLWVIVFYCFSSSAVLFVGYSLWKDETSLVINIRRDSVWVVFSNVAVLLNWGGLFYALRYLEPAVVGVASVASGPALTLVVAVFIKADNKVRRVEAVIAYLVLLSVGVMLYQSFIGASGLSSSSFEQRIIGIVSVVVCALGTVFYTFCSKKLYRAGWKSYEILAVRNVLIIIVGGLFVSLGESSLSLAAEWVMPMVVLVVLGHIVPVMLIQKAILHLSPLNVAFVLLMLPVFTLLLQYFDSRVSVSVESITAVLIIVVLLALLAVFNTQSKGRGQT